MKSFLLKSVFILFCLIISTFLLIIILKPIFLSNNIIVSLGVKTFNLSSDYPYLWENLKIIYIFSYFLSTIIISNSIFKSFFKKALVNSSKKTKIKSSNSLINFENLHLLIGENAFTHEKMFINEKSLYQNILITGTIGSGKTSSAMYPFLEQLISYKLESHNQKIGMLILDVKGNFYKQVIHYANKYKRLDDVLIIELNGKIKYNPLDKPKLKPSVLANRLKTILTLFSKNEQDSYWLDKAAELLTECIKFCRLYNNGYVNFSEIHKLVNNPDYYLEKTAYLRNLFQSGSLSTENSFDLLSCLEFFESEYSNLDSRVLSIIKSEVSRITSLFISDYDVINTFSPNKQDLNFHGFEDVISNGKIVVLNINIFEYENLSKIIATYLKLDFQSEVLINLSKNNSKPSLFMCDEYHEYASLTDSNFFSQSREAKCINIVATQSYTSLLSTLKEQSCVKVILQSLTNKLWFRTDDIFTIEDIQKQLGKEEKERISKSISENAKETNYNYITKTLNSKKSNISESFSSYTQLDYIYDTNFFTSNLETFTCLCFLSDGNKILEPCKIKLTPYFEKISNERIVIFNE